MLVTTGVRQVSSGESVEVQSAAGIVRHLREHGEDHDQPSPILLLPPTRMRMMASPHYSTARRGGHSVGPWDAHTQDDWSCCDDIRVGVCGGGNVC